LAQPHVADDPRSPPHAASTLPNLTKPVYTSMIRYPRADAPARDSLRHRTLGSSGAFSASPSWIRPLN